MGEPAEEYYLMAEVIRLSKTLEDVTLENNSLINLLHSFINKNRGADISNHPITRYYLGKSG